MRNGNILSIAQIFCNHMGNSGSHDFTYNYQLLVYQLYQKNFTQQQIQEAAMGSPVGTIGASLYLEEFKIRAINTAEHPPKVWKRNVDDTLWSQKHHTKKNS